MAISALSSRQSPRQSKFESNAKLPLSFIEEGFKDRLKERMRAFEVHLLARKGLVRGTIMNHRKAVQKTILEAGSIELTHEQIESRVCTMYEKGYSYSHVVNTIRALEAYSEYQGNRIQLGRPKKPRTIVKEALTEAEISIIIAACKNIRERVIITTLAYTGIRNQELCNLRVRDVDFGNNHLHVIEGKGKKSRVACMSGECAKVIIDYLGTFNRGDSDYLITTLRTGKQYQPWSLRHLVKTITARTNVSKRVHPHIFRHSLATNMLARGANLLTIKEQLGHAFIDTTMIYIQSRPQRIQSEYQLYTPSYI